MALRTLNQIVSRIRQLCESHQQVGSFFYGQEDDAENLNDLRYPAVKLIGEPGVLDVGSKMKRFGFSLYVIDLVHVANETKRNETEVISDTDQIVSDIVALLFHPQYQFDWDIALQSAIEPITYQGGDSAAGVALQIQISIPWLNDACQVPGSIVDFDNSFDMARTRVYTYTADGSEGSNMSVPFLSGKRIIAAFRGTNYRRPIITEPTDFESLQVGTVALSDGQGIVGNGSVVLISGDVPVENEKFDFLYYA